MITIQEQQTGRELSYSVQIKSGSKSTSVRKIHYSSVAVADGDRSYLMIYDTDMVPVAKAFDFLNFYMADQSENSRLASQNALKFLFSFEDIISKPVEEFTLNDINNLKRFLGGTIVESGDFKINNATVRSDETINKYLSVYREFLRFCGNNESPLFQKAHRYSVIYSPESEREFKAGAYKSSVKTGSVPEIPYYISVPEFDRIINRIREAYTVREEIVVRLMFENGLRIGEVLGLTWDDVLVEECIDPETAELQYVTVAYLRNRVSDRPYQHAKTYMKVASRKQYKMKKYRTEKVGYGRVVISRELYDMINDYIEEEHLRCREAYSKNYYSYAIADRVPGCEGEEDNYYIFLNSVGRPLSQTLWNYTVRQLFKGCGIPLDVDKKEHNLNHRFRHGCGMFNANILHKTEVELRDILRHKSTASVKCYYRPTMSDQIKTTNEFTESLYDELPSLRKSIDEAYNTKRKL